MCCRSEASFSTGSIAFFFFRFRIMKGRWRAHCQMLGVQKVNRMTPKRSRARALCVCAHTQMRVLFALLSLAVLFCSLFSGTFVGNNICGTVCQVYTRTHKRTNDNNNNNKRNGEAQPKVQQSNGRTRSTGKEREKKCHYLVSCLGVSTLNKRASFFAGSTSSRKRRLSFYFQSVLFFLLFHVPQQSSLYLCGRHASVFHATRELEERKQQQQQQMCSVVLRGGNQLQLRAFGGQTLSQVRPLMLKPIVLFFSPLSQRRSVEKLLPTSLVTFSFLFCKSLSTQFLFSISLSNCLANN